MLLTAEQDRNFALPPPCGDSVQYSLDGYKCLHEIISCIKNKKIISKVLKENGSFS
jgi:hypothetical protein